MITRYIYPLWLREKISYRLQRWFRLNLPDAQIPLFFAPGITMDVEPTDIGHQSIILNGFYELALSKRIVQLAALGGYLVDVGANYGYFSMLWLAQHPANRCVAFEAAPENIAALTKNIGQNHLATRAAIEPVALGEQRGFVDFTINTDMGQTGWGGIAAQAGPGTIRVPCTTLDAYWMEHFPLENIAVLKIDVEGADTLVLDGARNLLESGKVQHIFYEINRPRMQLLGIDENRAASLLKSCGYRLEYIEVNEIHAYR